MVLGALVERLGGPRAPGRADEAFLRAAELAPELQGLTYASIGTRGALVNEPVSLTGS
jgi:hypothetical protein